MLWLLLALGVSALILLIAWTQLNVHSIRPAVYSVRSAAEVEPYLRSWGLWLDGRGRIVIRQSLFGAEAELRKHRYKTRSDVLLFRYRNADGNKGTFEQVRARFDAEGVEYQLERSRKQHRARALTVILDPADVFTPVATVRLLGIALRSADAELQVFCEGRMRAGRDRPRVKLIPPRQAQLLGFRLGALIGRLWSRFTAA